MSHAAATFRAVDPLAVPVIEPAFQAALMLGGRAPSLVPSRGPGGCDHAYTDPAAGAIARERDDRDERLSV